MFRIMSSLFVIVFIVVIIRFIIKHSPNSAFSITNVKSILTNIEYALSGTQTANDK